MKFVRGAVFSCLFSAAWLQPLVRGFTPPTSMTSQEIATISSGTQLYAQPPQSAMGDEWGDPNEEGEESISAADARLSDLLPPTVNFSRDSVLFSENPSTQRNNPLLTFWRRVKKIVPPVVTGAWPWRDPYLAETDPMSAFYNICFVRLPIIAMGMIYTKNLVSGQPLIMDVGDGPFEMSPVFVYLVLAIVLA